MCTEIEAFDLGSDGDINPIQFDFVASFQVMERSQE